MAKLEDIVLQASKQHVELLVFGETWLSGYPAWIDHCPNIALWDNTNMKTAYRQLVSNGVTVDGSEVKKICSLARKFEISIVIGINERVDKGTDNGTLFNSVIIIDDQGVLRVHHRKLIPTFTEKMLYGRGDGQGLHTADLKWGSVGALICWEHWMPLTRQALHDSGEHIHIALWPQVHDMLQLCSRHYAFEGRCFLLAVGQIMTAGQIPGTIELPEKLLLNGGSCVIGPDGQFIVEPVFGKEELIVIDLDIDKTIEERMTLDTSGHYQRPDIFSLTINLPKD